MSQLWAKSFYNSKGWKDCRESYIASIYGLCERCNSKGIVKPGLILHHTIKLNLNNINNLEITLNHKHLRYLCKDCHEIEHYRDDVVIRDGLAFTNDGDITLAPPL